MKLFTAILAFAALAPIAGAQFSTANPTPGPGVPHPGGFLGGDPCATYDDGTTENSLGLTVGGWLVHMHYIDCLANVDEVLSAYGSLSLPGGITNGRPVRVAVWSDSDNDESPLTGLTFLTSVSATVTNASTDMLNSYPVTPTAVGMSAWIGIAVNHSASEFPAPMDVDNPTPRSWIFGNTSATPGIDLVNINNNNVAPTSMDAAGFPAAFMMRADGDLMPIEPGTGFCFCDAGSAFPSGACGNPGDVGNGCANGVTSAGANLAGAGTTSPDTLVLTASGLDPNQPSLFFQGTNAIASGDGITFGDGLRCAGQNLERLEIVIPDGTGTASTSISISAEGGVGPGDGSRFYQCWYRNPNGSPCGSGFNLTNGYEVVW